MPTCSYVQQMQFFNVLFATVLFLSWRAVDAAKQRRTTTTESSAPTVHAAQLNPYCNYTAVNPDHPTKITVDIHCSNDPETPVRDNFYTGLHPISFFQSDGGAMSRGVEEAIKMVRTRIPSKDLQMRVEVNGYHRRSHDYRYGKTVAVIDVSNKLAAGLGEKDEIELGLEQAGMRVDPRFDSEKVKVVARGSVVLVKWNYAATYSAG
ncbi:uncharacterized protein LOC129601589 [Paramacrobiotus metropolitanus]|uniref:uncharacterized protein LOC129601589 n=1 Tax=Paramacrobiotus metropolitanus TaxID=2943436 RepID=UPI002445A34C|nr:uncharacterized protein LOC129601589 [Paramacrobiotus metropolitanus]